MEKVSVIVPVYKVEKTLERCVNSIINQTYSELEIILVDDGSPDCCPQICDEYAKKDSRIKVIHQQNGGLSHARNTGIACATGQWILLVDSDDCIDKELCSEVYSCAREKQSDLVIFSFCKFSDGESRVNAVKKGTRSLLSNNEAMSLLSNQKIGNFAWNKFYKKELFGNIKYPDRRYYEDIGTTYRLIDKATKVSLLDSELYYYYQSDDSITHTITKKHVTDEFEQRLDQYNFLIEHNYEAAKLVREELLADALQYCIYCPYEPSNPTYMNASKVILNSKNVKQIFGGTYKVMYQIYRISIPIFNFVCWLFKKRL